MATTILGETVFDVDDINGEADVLLLDCDLDHVLMFACLGAYVIF